MRKIKFISLIMSLIMMITFMPILQQAFDGNFYRSTLITFLQSGMTATTNAAEYYLV